MPRRDNKYRYNGKELVNDLGLEMYLYGARVYLPRLNIFPSVDPIAEDFPWIDPYAYVFNNPINYVDPDGRNPIRAAIAAAKIGKRAYKIYRKTGRIDAKSLKKAGLDELVDIAGDLHTIFSGDASTLDRVSAAADLIIGSDFNKKGKKEVLGAVEDVSNSVKKIGKSKRGRGDVSPADRDPQRAFSKKQKQEMQDRQDGVCPNCNETKSLDQMDGHHIKRHADGGKTTTDNGVNLCKDCHKDVHRKE